MNIEPHEVIALHVGDPTLPLYRAFFPPENWVGMALLRRVVELALASEGLIKEGKCAGIGELNDSVFNFIVTNRMAAAERVMRELERLCLLPYCQIAILEVSGWRCIHPSAALRMNWLLDYERHQAATKKLMDGLALQQQRVKEWLESGHHGFPPGFPPHE